MIKQKLLTIVLFILGMSIGFAQGYKKVPFQEVKEIPEGKALVYIFRPSSMVGAAVHFTVNANDQKVSEQHLRNGTYLVFFADPGQYMFWATVSTNRAEVIVDLEAGNTYYIEGHSVSLELVSEEVGKKKIRKCKMLVEKK